MLRSILRLQPSFLWPVSSQDSVIVLKICQSAGNAFESIVKRGINSLLTLLSVKGEIQQGGEQSINLADLQALKNRLVAFVTNR
ncbi:hypothetical protein ACQKPX_05215 [Photobacterium sp. DNB23_23_1]